VSEPAPSRRLRGSEVLTDPLVAELLALRLIPVITTLEPDGSVHAVAIWAAVLDDAIVFGSGSSSRKVRNLERDPRATVVFHDSRPGFEVCGASIRGIAEIVRGDDAIPLVALVHDRYVTRESRSLPGATAVLGSDDVAILVRPERAVTWDMRPNPASEELRRAGGALPLEPTSPRP
jgi:PPOX class probable F420-dependent enzyme